ncbi:MAG: hypothetical protein ACD_79C01131G0009 [uncultured bacterium]|nr:MAG: hypothetical protein ACD_79C01131G0009 [uncultured bacterium]
MHGLLHDIGIAIIAATIIGIITHAIKQPIIVGYLIAGIIIGPEIGQKLITNVENIELISEIGLVLLLFVIGLELDLKAILKSGKQILILGVGQFFICVIFGLLVFYFVGYSFSTKNQEVLYLSLLCALSSTAIVVKSLNDKFEIETLTGRTSVGVLIIQDLWAIMLLAFQPNFNNPEFLVIGISLLKSVILIALGFLISKHILKKIFKSVSKSPELVISISLGWCAFMAGLADFMGLSKEMGALIAGLSISVFPYSIHVTAKTLPLRDSFLILFFVSLGMKIIAPEYGIIKQSLLVVFFIVISRFASIIPLVLMSGGGLRTGFITSLNIAQLSEFSLVVASIGVVLGHIKPELFSMLIYAMAFSAIISSYFIKYNHELFRLFEKFLKLIKLRKQTSLMLVETLETTQHSIVLLGCHRGAMSFLHHIAEKQPEFLPQILVVDFNLETIKELKRMKVSAVFGDISQLDTLTHLNIDKTKIIISTIPDVLLKGINNASLVKMCRLVAPEVTIVATADMPSQIEELRKMGANEVLLPYSMAGEYLASYIKGLFAKEY